MPVGMETFEQPNGDQMSVDFDIEDPSLVDCSDKQDRGVLKKIIKEGTGNDMPFEGSTVHVHYVGRLVDGSVFDSSRTRNEPFSFVLGKRKVIQAWDMGVATMKQGEVCELVCKSSYAYGKIGSPPKIPGDATLIFQVELLNWEDEDLSAGKDKKVLRRIIKKGTGYTSPNENAKVKVRLCGMYEGRKFDEREVEYTVDEGEEENIVPGIDTAVKKMKKHECSLFTFHPDLAFGREGKQEWEIPSNAEVRYEITLLDFEKAKETWSMNPEEKMEAAEKAREKGTQSFTKGNITTAIKQYEKMKELLGADSEFKDDNENKRKKILAVSHLNLAAAHLKLNDLYAAKRAAEEALQLDRDNVKGLYRRGSANFGLKDYEDAKRDFQRILELEPDKKAARQQLALVNKDMRAQTDKEKKKFQGMFEKFAAEDSRGSKKPEAPMSTNGSGDNTA